MPRVGDIYRRMFSGLTQPVRQSGRSQQRDDVAKDEELGFQRLPTAIATQKTAMKAVSAITSHLRLVSARSCLRKKAFPFHERSSMPFGTNILEGASEYPTMVA